MTEVATPAEVVPEVTPAPTAPAATPAPAPAEETVVLTKEQHAQLARDAARAASNQRKADLFDSLNKGTGRFAPPAPVTPPSPEDVSAYANAEDRKAERGLTAIAADPAYREVLDADPTLRSLLIANPLAVLPMLAPDALDAEDAINLVKESLNGRKKPATPTPAPVPAPATPPAPPSGVVNPPASQQANDDWEAAKKNPNTEHAIAGMVTAKMKQGS